MPELDQSFINQYVKPGVTRTLADGLEEETARYTNPLTGAVSNDPGVGKNIAVGIAGSVKDAASHPWETLVGIKRRLPRFE